MPSISNNANREAVESQDCHLQSTVTRKNRRTMLFCLSTETTTNISG